MILILAVVLGLGHPVFYPSKTYFLFPLICLCLSLILILYGHYQVANSLIKKLGVVLFSFALASVVGFLQINHAVQNQLPQNYSDQIFPLTLKIVSLPERKARSFSYKAQVVSGDCGEPCEFLKNKILRLSWYQNDKTLEPGQIWALQVKLKRPRGFVNPNSFDFHAWLLGQGICATGYVTKGPALLKGQDRGIHSLRFDLSKEINALYSDFSSRFFKALLIGDKSAITAEEWRVLQRTGTIHLMAISGLHVGLMALWGLFLGRCLARFYAAVFEAASGWVWHTVPLMFSTLFALGYAAMAGFSIPTQRAVLACVIFNICWALGQRINPMRILLVIAILVLIIQPFAFLDQGFCLSFAAVAVILAAFLGRKESRIRSFLRMQYVLFIGLALPLLAFGQATSMVGIVANTLAVPAISFVIVPGLMLSSALTFLGIDGIAHVIFVFLGAVFEWLWVILELLSSISFSQWWPKSHFSVVGVMLFLGAAAFLLMPKGLYVRWLGLIFAAVMVLPTFEGFAAKPSSSSASLAVMDVGQGLAVVVNTGEETWLYDTGPRYSANFDAGSRILAPYLRKQGVQEVSVIAGHADVDHNGGYEGLAESIPIEQLYYGEVMERAPPSSKPCARGQSWRSGSVAFKVLWPQAGHQLSGNNASCVLMLEFEQANSEHPVRVLIPGDIDKSVEWQLLDEIRGPIDVLVAPHHGSRTSSSEAFIRALNPRFVVVSAGYKNRYGHPHANVVARYHSVNAEVLNTAVDGALTFDISPSTGSAMLEEPLSHSLKVRRQRKDSPRLWID